MNLWNYTVRVNAEKNFNEILAVQHFSDKDAAKKTIDKNINSLESKFQHYRYDTYLFRSGLKNGSDFDRFLTPKLLLPIKQAYSDYDINDTFFEITRGLKEKYIEARSSVSSIYIAMVQADAIYAPDSPNEGPIIEIVFPEYVNLLSFSKLTSDQDTILKLLNECLFGTQEDIEILSISSSRISAFLKSNYKYITHFSAAVCFILTSANSMLDIRIKMNEISDATGLPYESEFYNKAKEQIALKCAEKISEAFTSGDKFDIQKCTLVAKRLLDSIESGFEYHVHIPPIGEASDGQKNEAEAVNSEAEARKILLDRAAEIDKRFEMLPPLKGPRLIANKGETSE
ncbi:hypothetical protein LB559_02110 [Mesorhizobium sp. BR1-1-3]|uniref:hypothetical protein n=1 Tax=Mesorhizobium sp. BR1-1-3 TaxID=2876651 RepID=UPI001CD123CD|nr:hypothetical protein [Mesorhizobium sp. BR1-1-3]MBZ9886740.1 hypothetical protein [Mesorhizobium sp. BR1-1-3]